MPQIKLFMRNLNTKKDAKLLEHLTCLHLKPPPFKY